jgi:hypothetical protein
MKISSTRETTIECLGRRILTEVWTETCMRARTRTRTDSLAASIGLEVTGSAQFIDLVDALLEEYSVVLITIELGVEPADLPPLDVAIDVKK